MRRDDGRRVHKRGRECAWWGRPCEPEALVRDCRFWLWWRGRGREGWDRSPHALCWEEATEVWRDERRRLQAGAGRVRHRRRRARRGHRSQLHHRHRHERVRRGHRRVFVVFELELRVRRGALGHGAPSGCRAGACDFGEVAVSAAVAQENIPAGTLRQLGEPCSSSRGQRTCARMFFCGYPMRSVIRRGSARQGGGHEGARTSTRRTSRALRPCGAGGGARGGLPWRRRGRSCHAGGCGVSERSKVGHGAITAQRRAEMATHTVHCEGVGVISSGLAESQTRLVGREREEGSVGGMERERVRGIGRKWGGRRGMIGLLVGLPAFSLYCAPPLRSSHLLWLCSTTQRSECRGAGA